MSSLVARGPHAVKTAVLTLGHTQSNGLGISQTETANTLEATSSVNQAVAQPRVFQQNTRDEVRYISQDGQIAGALTAEAGAKQQNYIHGTAIRRLTPIECERLQGFPDDWTKIPYRNKPADQCPDGPRYKACGNSMAVPVMRWIGQRIQLIDTIIN